MQWSSGFTGVPHRPAVNRGASLRCRQLRFASRPVKQALAAHEKLPQVAYPVDAHGHEVHGRDALQHTAAHAVLQQALGDLRWQARGERPGRNVLRAPVAGLQVWRGHGFQTLQRCAVPRAERHALVVARRGPLTRWPVSWSALVQLKLLRALGVLPNGLPIDIVLLADAIPARFTYLVEGTIRQPVVLSHEHAGVAISFRG